MKFLICQKKDNFDSRFFDDVLLNSTKAPSLISNKVYKKELSNFIVFVYTYDNIYDEDEYYLEESNEIKFINGMFTIDESEGIDSLDDFFDAISDNKLILGSYQALKLDDKGDGFLISSIPSVFPIFYYENEYCTVLSNEFKLIVDSVAEFRENKFADFYDLDYMWEIQEYGEYYDGDDKTTYSHTIFKNIKRILANDKVTFEDGLIKIEYGCEVNVPEWFDEWYVEDKDSLYDWYYDKLLWYTEEFTKIISKKTTKVTAGITGGFDSRVTCLILSKILPKYDIELMTNTRGLNHHPDVVIGKKIASELNLNWENINYVTKEEDDLRYFPQSFQEYAKVFYATHGELSSYDSPPSFSRDVSNVHEFFQYGNTSYKHETLNRILILGRWISRRNLHTLDIYFPLFSTKLEMWFALSNGKYHPREKYYKEFIYNVLKRGDSKLLDIPFAFDFLPQVDVEKYKFKGYYSTRHHEQPFLWDYQYVLDKLGGVLSGHFQKHDDEYNSILFESGINSLDYHLLKDEIDSIMESDEGNIKQKLIDLKKNAHYPQSRQFVDLKPLRDTFYITTHLLRLMDFSSAANFNSFDNLERSCSFNMEDNYLEIEDELYEKLDMVKAENKRLLKENNDYKNEIEGLNNLNKEIISSKSWKITKPLRNVMNSFRK